MNDKEKYHAAIFTTAEGNLHFLITSRCTYDDASQTVYKPHLMDKSVSLALASFPVTEHVMNGRELSFGQSTGEDGSVIWRDEFDTMAVAFAGLWDSMAFLREQSGERMTDLEVVESFEENLAALKQRGLQHALSPLNEQFAQVEALIGVAEENPHGAAESTNSR